MRRGFGCRKEPNLFHSFRHALVVLVEEVVFTKQPYSLLTIRPLFLW